MEPILNQEAYLAKLTGEDVDLPEPLTRTEAYLAKLVKDGVGQLPEIEIGEVRAAADGEQPSVTITGTAKKPILNFVLPTSRAVLG